MAKAIKRFSAEDLTRKVFKGCVSKGTIGKVEHILNMYGLFDKGGEVTLKFVTIDLEKEKITGEQNKVYPDREAANNYLREYIAGFKKAEDDKKVLDKVK